MTEDRITVMIHKRNALFQGMEELDNDRTIETLERWRGCMHLSAASQRHTAP